MTTPTTITIPIDPSFDDLDAAVGGLTQEQVITLASDLLSFVRAPYQVWAPIDIESRFDEEVINGATRYRYADRLYTRAERALLVEHAQEQRAWRDLADADDADWMLVEEALDRTLADFAEAGDEIGEEDDA